MTGTPGNPAPGWRLGRQTLDLSVPRVMGILNLTPDSFFDGGRHDRPAAAADHARRLVAEGADLVDIGAESTRPGSAPVGAAAETARLMPVLERLAGQLPVPISVDTCRAAVARRALETGATAVNDVSAGADPAMFPLVARTGAGLVLMHMRGQPATMQDNPTYHDVVAEIGAFLAARLEAARAAGIAAGQIVLDPGIGFGKTTAHNLAIIAGAGSFRAAGRPVLIGASRKGFIGQLDGAPADGRLGGTIAAVLAAWHAGAVIFRVHDVAAVRQALLVARAIAAADSPRDGGNRRLPPHQAPAAKERQG